jgi:hypothetical protein
LPEQAPQRRDLPTPLANILSKVIGGDNSLREASLQARRENLDAYLSRTAVSNQVMGKIG